MVSGAPARLPAQVGETFTRRLRLSEAEIRAFATSVHDFNPLHHDAEVARAAGYPGLIASGTQVGSHLMALTASHFALPLLIRRPGGLVVEMTDGTADYNATNYRLSTFYDLAKTSVVRMAFAQGHELAPHGCTAVALSPGWMRTEMMLEIYGVTEDTWREALTAMQEGNAALPFDEVEPVLVAELGPGSSASSGELAQEYGFTDLDGSRPDCWRYMVEVQDPGLPPDATGYR